MTENSRKPSDTKRCPGLSLSVVPMGSLRGTGRDTSAMIRRMEALVTYCRSIYAGIANKLGPRTYIVTECEDCGHHKLTHSSAPTTLVHTQHRWGCTTCDGFSPPAWTEKEYKFDEKDARKSHATWVRKRRAAAEEERIARMRADRKPWNPDPLEWEGLAKAEHREFVRRNGCTVKRVSPDGTCEWCEGVAT